MFNDNTWNKETLQHFTRIRQANKKGVVEGQDGDDAKGEACSWDYQNALVKGLSLGKIVFSFCHEVVGVNDKAYVAQAGEELLLVLGQ